MTETLLTGIRCRCADPLCHIDGHWQPGLPESRQQCIRDAVRTVRTDEYFNDAGEYCSTENWRDVPMCEACAERASRPSFSGRPDNTFQDGAK